MKKTMQKLNQKSSVKVLILCKALCTTVVHNISKIFC